MHAVIVVGGSKQYRVKVGQIVRLETQAAEAGDAIEFANVLMISDGENTKVGVPFISGCKVMAEVVAHGRGDKIRIIKFRRRKHHMKTQGHRQNYTDVKITGIPAA